MRAFENELKQVPRAGQLSITRGLVKTGDHPAERNPRLLVDALEYRFERVASVMVQVDVDALGTVLRQRIVSGISSR